MIRNSTTSGSRIDIKVGLGSGRSYLALDYDIDLFAPYGTTRITTIALSSDQIRPNAPNSYTINLVVTLLQIQFILQPAETLVVNHQ